MSGSRFSSEFAMAFDQLAKYVDLIAAETARCGSERKQSAGAPCKAEG